jgi:hypothetical protein
VRLAVQALRDQQALLEVSCCSITFITSHLTDDRDHLDYDRHYGGKLLYDHHALESLHLVNLSPVLQAQDASARKIQSGYRRHKAAKCAAFRRALAPMAERERRASLEQRQQRAAWRILRFWWKVRALVDS